MRAEVEWALEALDTVVSMQPSDHPLRRVDRDRARVYESGQSFDMTTPMRDRVEELKSANFVGVASETRDNEPLGTEYFHSTDAVLSMRLEGLIYGEFGHIDPAGTDGVVFDDLYDTVRAALLDHRTYPQDSAFRDAKLDLRVQNEDFQLKDYADFFRADFDLVFRGRESLP